MSAATVIYARQSMDRHGDNLAVSRQLDLCREFAADRGWTVQGEYVDNDRSATTGVERPEFARLLDAKPSRVVVWHIDRLVRLTSDLERVIDMGADIHAVQAGHLDLSNPAGRAVARTVTAWAQYETEQKGLRQRAANDQRARAGLPYAAGRAFGFDDDGITHRESEAAHLRQAAADVLRGVSLSAVARQWNEAGVLSARGNRWSPTTVKAVLLSPRTAGMRRHRGEVVGKGAWPAILDEETFAALRAVLTAPERTRPGPPRRYLLSGVLRCGVCGEAVHGAYVKDNNKGATYRHLPHVTRNAARVDEFVRGVLVARLSMPDALEAFDPHDAAGEVERLTAERRELRARLDGLAEAFAVGDIDRRAMTVGTERVRDRLDALEVELRAVTQSNALAEVATSDDVEATLNGLPQDVLRQVIDAVMVPYLDRVGAGKRPADAGVRIEWRNA